MLWGDELERRLRASGSNVDVMLAHPGWAFTNLQNATPNALVNRLISAVCSLFAQPAASGALPVLFAATQPLPPLRYVGPDRLGAPTLLRKGTNATDADTAQWLWQWAERETGVTYPLTPSST